MRKLSFVVLLLCFALLWPGYLEAKPLCGKVTRADGKISTDAFVTFVTFLVDGKEPVVDWDNYRDVHTATDLNGKYCLNIPESGEITVWATEVELHPLYLFKFTVKNSRQVRYVEGNELDVVFLAPGPISLTGKASYPKDDPDSDAGPIQIYLVKRDKSFGISVFSKDDGTYEAKGLIPGFYEFFAIGGAGQIANGITILIQNESKLDLILKPFNPREK